MPEMILNSPPPRYSPTDCPEKIKKICHVKEMGYASNTRKLPSVVNPDPDLVGSGTFFNKLDPKPAFFLNADTESQINAGPC
jgi:hypothetical protein